MAAYLLRVEGVNFSATVYDTSELSTVRGASLALLYAHKIAGAALEAAPGVREPVLEYAGASQAVFSFEATNDKAAADAAQGVCSAFASPEEKDEIYKYLSFVVDIISSDANEPLEAVTAKNRARQFREWTVDLPLFIQDAKGYDIRDKMRPATRYVPKDEDLKKVLDPSDAEDEHAPNASASAWVRRRYGRDARQRFYVQEFPNATPNPASGLSYANSFEALVHAGKNDLPSLPLSLKNKMAVIYADGNKFGQIRAALAKSAGGDLAATRKFSNELLDLRRKLLAKTLEWYKEGNTQQKNRFAVSEEVRGQTRDGLRLETLLWGGDELIFVMSSWLAFAYLDGFFQVTSAWSIGGERLTHAVGLVICHHKTPIRQARKIAKDLADSAKEVMKPIGGKPQNTLSWAIFESNAPPDTDLSGYRRRLFGAQDADKDTLATALVLPADEVDVRSADGRARRQFGVSRALDVVKRLKRADATGLPRSQIYALLRAVRKNNGFFAVEAKAEIEKELDRYALRAGKDPAALKAAVKLPSLDGMRLTAIDLGLIAELWDYVEPFDDGLPDFPSGEGAA